MITDRCGDVVRYARGSIDGKRERERENIFLSLNSVIVARTKIPFNLSRNLPERRGAEPGEEEARPRFSCLDQSARLPFTTAYVEF